MISRSINPGFVDFLSSVNPPDIIQSFEGLLRTYYSTTIMLYKELKKECVMKRYIKLAVYLKL